MNRSRFLFCALAAGAALLLAPARAAAQLNFAGKFNTPGSELDVASFTAEGKRVGLLGIAGTKRNSFSFNLAEWLSFIELWKKAAAAQSASWTQVGTLTETGTADVSRVTLEAGPGVRVSIESPKIPKLTHVVPAAELGRFAAALDEVKAYLQGK